MSADLLTRPIEQVVVAEEIETTNNKDDAAHMVLVPPGEPDQTPQAYVMRARVDGFPIMAICGHVWIPFKNANNLPVCQECLDNYNTKDRSDDSGSGLPDA